jgi:hypothetical protein
MCLHVWSLLRVNIEKKQNSSSFCNQLYSRSLIFSTTCYLLGII